MSSLATATPVAAQGADIATVTTTIASGASLTTAIDLGTKRLAGIIIPASWTTANLTLQASADGTNWFNVYDALGTEYTITAAASRAIIVPLTDMIGFRYLKIRSGTSGTPVNQTAARTLTLICVR